MDSCPKSKGRGHVDGVAGNEKSNVAALRDQTITDPNELNVIDVAHSR